MIYRNSIFITKYSYSPITQYHKIKPYFKVHCIFSILLFAPYISSNQAIYFMLIIFLLIEISSFGKLLYSSNLKKIKLMILMIYCIIFMNQITIHNNINSLNEYKKLSILKLKLTYFLKISLLKVHKNIVNLKHYFILLTIPNYVLKLISIYVMLNNLLKILYLCTKYENVLETFIINLNRIKKKLQLHCKDYIIDLFLAFIFLQELAICLINTKLGVQIKNISLVNKNKYNFDIILVKYLRILLNNQIHYSLILWNRNILYKNFDYLRIYD
uniref:F-box domain-containing protein n=1 Tax=Laurencia australis TaxID=3073067 RepID=A0AA51RFG9_9FLOR|nr:hypothetical protein [Laurencia australis]WMP12033.1 hypothetical protein [Laurencia australis]